MFISVISFRADGLQEGVQKVGYAYRRLNRRKLHFAASISVVVVGAT